MGCTFSIEEDIFRHNGEYFFVGVNIMPLNEGAGEILDDFPELLFGKVSLLLLPRVDFEVKGVYVGLVGDLFRRIVTLTLSTD